MKRVEVHWLDTLGSATWESIEQKMNDATPAAMHHRSLGWLLRDDEDGVLICASMNTGNSGVWKDIVSDCNMIPRGVVIDVVEI